MRTRLFNPGTGFQLDATGRHLQLVQPSTGGSPASSLLDGLLAYWTLNEATGAVRLDSTGNGHDMSPMNGVTQGAGIVGHDAVFASASSQYLSTGSPVVIADNLPWSFAGWIKPTGTPNASDVLPALYGHSLTTGAFERAFLLAPTTVRIYRADNTAHVDVDFSGTPFSADTWSHVAITSDGAGTVRVYCNGVDGSAPFVVGIGVAALGALSTAGDLPLGGELDEVGVWARELSASNVMALAGGITWPFVGVP